MGEARRRQFRNAQGELEYEYFKGNNFREDQKLTKEIWVHYIVKRLNLSKGWFRKHKHLFKTKISQKLQVQKIPDINSRVKITEDPRRKSMIKTIINFLKTIWKAIKLFFLKKSF